MGQKRKYPQITTRMPEALLLRLDSACRSTGLDQSTITKACIEAFCDTVEREGGIWLPLQVIPKKKLGAFGSVSAVRGVRSSSLIPSLPTDYHFSEEETARVAETPTESPRTRKKP